MGYHNAGAQLGDKLLARVPLVAPTLAPETPVEAGRVVGPVHRLMPAGGVVAVRVVERL